MRRVIAASARAFASPRGEGGNPVSIFMPATPTTPEERTDLAQTCAWESVVVETDSEGSTPPTFHFFMPSGEEVSFCGHAAIGACSFLANKPSIASNEDEMELQSLSSTATISFLAASNGSRYDAKVNGNNETELLMDCVHEEAECNPRLLKTVLSAIGLESVDLPSTSEEDDVPWPIFINSSVARPKTLIPVRTVERLHAATAPRDADAFRRLCDSLDTTGVYLYSACRGRLECRQFPRSSGYPEDPATGIAAGALAASLLRRQITFDSNENEGHVYDVHQGTAMGRPSKIRVKIDGYTPKEANATLRISYTGLVVFDSVSQIK
ncbi:hypothetical protein ACHAXT_010717 [Thalassiosira profunda]